MINNLKISLAYSYNGSYGTGCTLTTPTNAVIGAALTRDPYRRRQVTDVVTAFNGLEITAHSYAFDGLGRVTNAVRSIRPLALASTNAYAYNARSEVIGALIETNDYAYIYDSLGNNLYTSLNAVTNAYTVNNLNQYTSISNFVSFAPSCEINPHYDFDGNMVRLANHILTYDAENRLSAYTFGIGSSTGMLRSAYVYDHLGRRIKKRDQERRIKNPGGIVPLTYWHTNTVTTFVYDGWNLIYERIAYTNGTVDEVEYVWGLDLSGTLQGAGGVGGLLAVSIGGDFLFPCYDNNGNITAYIDEGGTVVAYRKYDAFGNTIAKGGAMVDVLHFWYSTKYLDHDTGLYYYGYRYYSSLLQRWINRDPIEESGGVNMYGFVHNDPMNRWDRLGLISIAPVDDSPVVSYEPTPADKGYISFFASAFIIFDDVDNATLLQAGGGVLVHGKRVTVNLRHCSTGENLKETQAVQKRFNVTANFSDPGGKSWPATDGRQYIYFNLADRKRISKCYKGVVEVNAKWVLYPHGVLLPPVGDNIEDTLSGSQDGRDTHGKIGSTSGWPDTRAGGYISSGWFTFTIRFSCNAQPSVTATITPLYPYALGRPGRGGYGTGYEWPTE